MRRFPNALFVPLVAPVLLAACAGTVAVDLFDSPERIWPDFPETARIAYFGEFSTSSDLGIKESFWSRVVSFATGPSHEAMVRPMAVAATVDGQVIFVADPEANCVHRYDLLRNRYSRLTTGRDMPDASPIGLAVTDDGWLFATDSRQGLLYRAAPDDSRLDILITEPELKQPTGIFWDSGTDRLLVTDTAKQTILVFDRSGNLKQTVSGRGADPGRFNFPTYLWMDSQNELLVTDSLNFRIQRFDSKGNFLHQFGQNGDEPGFFSRPKGIATDSLGHVYVVDALMHLLQIFDRQGELLLSIGGQGQGAGEFWLPNGIFITSDNTIYIADAYNKRIQVFRYIGPQE